MARVGINADTGEVLVGWPHCAQSIRDIFRTELDERVQRRPYGAEMDRVIDRPQNEETVIDLYQMAAEALEPRIVEGHQYGEPGFVLLRAGLDASTPGTVNLLLSGVFFENGHLGDFSIASEQQLLYDITSFVSDA